MPPEPESVADRVAESLARYLGPHTARVAVKTFSLKALGRGPDTLARGDVPQLLGALRPMLRAFVGRAHAEVVLREIADREGV